VDVECQRLGRSNCVANPASHHEELLKLLLRIGSVIQLKQLTHLSDVVPLVFSRHQHWQHALLELIRHPVKGRTVGSASVCRSFVLEIRSENSGIDFIFPPACEVLVSLFNGAHDLREDSVSVTCVHLTRVHIPTRSKPVQIYLESVSIVTWEFAEQLFKQLVEELVNKEALLGVDYLFPIATSLMFAESKWNEIKNVGVKHVIQILVIKMQAVEGHQL